MLTSPDLKPYDDKYITREWSISVEEQKYSHDDTVGDLKYWEKYDDKMIIGKL